MKRLIAVLLVLIVGVAGLGFYLGWFQVTSNGDGDRTNYTITVDKAKIQSDKDKAIGRAQEAGEELKSKPESEAPPPPPEVAPAQPAPAQPDDPDQR